MIKIYPCNETFIKVQIDDFGVEQELSDFFTFFSTGYKFSKAFKNGSWDGKIRLYNMRTKQLYKGLIDVVIRFAKNYGYKINIDPSLFPEDRNIGKEEIEQFCSELKISNGSELISIRDYQIDAIYKALKTYRKILISPTGSGKSLIIYAIIRYLLENDPDERIVLIVPTTMLVEQMFTDFVEYSSLDDWKPENYIQLLYSGKERDFTKSMMISTWQSLHAMKKSKPDQFKNIAEKATVAIFDEAHTYSATEIRGTIEMFSSTKRRIGTSGTLDNSKVNELVLTGLMGTPYTVKTTRQLIDEGVLTDIQIHITKLKYPEHVCKSMKGSDYQGEIDFIVGSEERNRFIANLALKCQGATLITFAFVEKHGKILYEMIKSKSQESGRNIYYVSGETEADERQLIRKLVNEDPNSIVVASEKLFSTGVNIPGLTNIILAMPRKSPILIRQTIGRGLRKFEGKHKMHLFDIADDLSTKSKRNHAMRSLAERMTIYIKEQFDYSIHEIPMSKYWSGLDSIS